MPTIHNIGERIVWNAQKTGIVLRAEGGIENLPSLSLDPGLSGQGYRLVQSADGKEVRLYNLRGMVLIFR